MAYGNDVSVYVEDTAGDLGAPGSPAPWWISPDVDIPAHTGQAVQGVNDVRIRVHAHEEPIVEELIAADVFVGNPGLVLSPTTGTIRIDPGTLRFRPAGVAGTEPIADEAGGTLTFPWTPSATAGAIDGPGHRCLIVRAYPVSVTPPTSPFDVPNEQHEAMHNCEILTTTTAPGSGKEAGAGTGDDPRRRDRRTGMWSEEFTTMAIGRKGRRVVLWAFDPQPEKWLPASVRDALEKAGIGGFSPKPPSKVTLEAVGAASQDVDPDRLLKKRGFAKRAGLGRKSLFPANRLVGAIALDLATKEPAELLLRFDHSNLEKRTAVVLHGAQWDEKGDPEGGMTLIALAPTDD